MKLAVWSPLPPSPSGIADYVAEQIPYLARHAEVVTVAEDTDPPQADLHVYHLGNSPAHAYVYRAALARPGVVVLHDWSLHHLVLKETVERGDRHSYLREMRRAHGETGEFVGRQVAQALGGDLFPALFPLNDRVLAGSLGIVGLTEYVSARAARRRPDRPVLRVSHHLWLPFDPVPSRAEARQALGLDQDALLLTAPGLATASKRLDVAVKVVARLRRDHPALRLVVAGAVDLRLPLETWGREADLGDALVVTGRLGLREFALHLAAADVVLGLRFPTHGEMSGALIRALGVGRPVLVTAGSPASEEFPSGIVVPVDPGPGEEAELEALVDHLLRRPSLRESIGRLAREHVRRDHDLATTTARLADFLATVLASKDATERMIAVEAAEQGTLLGYLGDEVRQVSRELGLARLPPELGSFLAELVGGRG